MRIFNTKDSLEKMKVIKKTTALNSLLVFPIKKESGFKKIIKKEKGENESVKKFNYNFN